LKLSDVPVDLDALQDKIESAWPHFNVMSYSLVYCNQSKESDVSNTQRLRELLGLHPQSSTHMFKVKKMCLGFSDYCDKNKAEKVLSKLNAYSSDPAMIQQVNDMFALENPLQWSVLIKQESGNIQTELLRRRKIDLTIGVSEYTKREFISPVLIGSLQIVDEITMMCEKKIIGSFGNGPVDYSLIYKNINIVLTEAKKEDMEGGLIQNLVQQEASHESLAYAILPADCKNVAVTRNVRKRKFDEISKSVARLPSYGIVTNGNCWIFSKIVRNPDNNSSVIYKSSPFKLILSADGEKECAAQLEEIEIIVSGIVAICLQQKCIIDTNQELGQILNANTTAIAIYENSLVESYESIKKSNQDDEDDEDD